MQSTSSHSQEQWKIGRDPVEAEFLASVAPSGQGMVLVPPQARLRHRLGLHSVRQLRRLVEWFTDRGRSSLKSGLASRDDRSPTK